MDGPKLQFLNNRIDQNTKLSYGVFCTTVQELKFCKTSSTVLSLSLVRDKSEWIEKKFKTENQA